MTNHWVTYDDPIAGWVADLTPLRHEPQALVDWLRKVLDEGEADEVFKVRAAPLAGYAWDNDGPLADYLMRSFSETGVVDLFQFASSQSLMIGDSRFQAFARMAYFDAQGQLTESDVDDLGLLLRSLRPVDFEANWGLFHRCVPLLITGPKIDFSEPQRSVWAYKPDEILIRFRLFSDIWFPWVLGFLEESFDLNRMYDNRPLAQCHSPRVNRFLSFASNLTRTHGGIWTLDEEDSRTLSKFMLTTDGIDLDVALPVDVMEHHQ